MLWYLSSGRRLTLSQTAKLFINGRSQAVRLPVAFHFDAKEVFIRGDAETDDIILSRLPPRGTISLRHANRASKDASSDFLDAKERKQTPQERDPFDGWQE